MVSDRIFGMLDHTDVIYTERLFMRRLTSSDVESLFKIANDPNVSRYLLWDPHPTLKYTNRYLKTLKQMYRDHTYFEWGVFLRDTGLLIGTCGFTSFKASFRQAEIGYSFGVPYWGQGYATEAVAATLQYGFQTLYLERIEACFAMQNIASAHVLDKCGMQYLGEGERMLIKGNEERVGMYAISRENYMASQLHKSRVILL